MYCNKKNVCCVEQTPIINGGLVILNHTPASEPALSVSRKSRTPPLQNTQLRSSCDSDLFVNHFFTSFIAKNDFGTAIDVQTIISQFQSSSSLFQVSAAIGALDLSRKSPSKYAKATFEALKSYRISVLEFQTEIQRNNFLKSDEGLWATLFLGLFEVCSIIRTHETC